MLAMFYRAGWHVGGLGLHLSTYTTSTQTSYMYVTHARNRECVCVCVCKAARHRKVLRDIASAIRPSFWELNFCGSRLRSPSPSPLSTLKLGPVRAKDRALLTRDLRRFFSPLLAAIPCISLVTITGQSRARVIYESVIYPPLKHHGDSGNLASLKRARYVAVLPIRFIELRPIQLHRRKHNALR